MSKTLILLFISIFSLSSIFAQDDMGDFTPGSEKIFFAYYGEICSELTREEERMQCSNDQINEYISTLGIPDIVEKKKKMAVVLNFELKSSGKMVNISIKKSSGNEKLDAIVLEHFKKMPNWQAMTIGGVPFDSPDIEIIYKFKPSAK